MKKVKIIKSEICNTPFHGGTEEYFCPFCDAWIKLAIGLDLGEYEEYEVCEHYVSDDIERKYELANMYAFQKSEGFVILADDIEALKSEGVEVEDITDEYVKCECCKSLIKRDEAIDLRGKLGCGIEGYACSEDCWEFVDVFNATQGIDYCEWCGGIVKTEYKEDACQYEHYKCATNDGRVIYVHIPYVQGWDVIVTDEKGNEIDRNELQKMYREVSEFKEEIDDVMNSIDDEYAEELYEIFQKEEK